MGTKTYCRIKLPLLLLLHGHKDVLSYQTQCTRADVHQGILSDQHPPSPSTVNIYITCTVYKRTRVPLSMCAQTHMCAFMYVGAWFVLNQTGFSRNGSKKRKEKIWEGPLPTIARLDQFQIHSQQHLKLFQVVRYKVMFFTTFFLTSSHILSLLIIYICSWLALSICIHFWLIYIYHSSDHMFLVGSEYMYSYLIHIYNHSTDHIYVPGWLSLKIKGDRKGGKSSSRRHGDTKPAFHF